MGNCCSQGGCCRQSPPPFHEDEHGQVDRANLLYYNCGCYTFHQGYKSRELQRVLDALAQKGLDPGLVESWFTHRKLLEAQRRTRKCCPDAFFGLATLLVPIFWCFIPYLCREHARDVKEWDGWMREWQDDFNKEVLEPRGMFIKTQSRCVVKITRDRNGRQRRTRHIEKWFAITMTEEASSKLKSEAHIEGDTQPVACCVSDLHESELCMHY